jgi:hypothetical protein
MDLTPTEAALAAAWKSYFTPPIVIEEESCAVPVVLADPIATLLA